MFRVTNKFAHIALLLQHLLDSAVTDDIEALSWHVCFLCQRLVDDPAYCPRPFLPPKILPGPSSSSCQTSRNVCDRCDQSLTSMVAAVSLLGQVKFVSGGFSSFFLLLTRNGWYVCVTLRDNTNSSSQLLPCLNNHCIAWICFHLDQHS